MSKFKTRFRQCINWFRTMGDILITPVAALPLAGLLIMAGDITGRFNFIGASVLSQTGTILLAQLPLLIAISLAYGMATEKPGEAGLAGALSYLVLTRAGSVVFSLILGESVLPVFDMGVFGGVIAGVIAVFMHNHYRSLKLPNWLSFFNGVRFSALLAIVVSLLAGIGFGALWTLLQIGLTFVADKLVLYDAGGAFAYGFLHQLLMPFGLHHVLNQEIWYNIGEFTSKTGQLITGDLSRFLAGDPTAGRYTAGFFPMMIFGLPAIATCFAITARMRTRTRMILLMALAGLVSLVSGVAEPLEYLILFTSPLLYLIYALLLGLSIMICFQLQVLFGFTYSTGLSDFLTSWQSATRPDGIWQVGIVIAILSFGVTYIAIRLLKLRTPGNDRLEFSAEPETDLESLLKVTRKNKGPNVRKPKVVLDEKVEASASDDGSAAADDSTPSDSEGDRT